MLKKHRLRRDSSWAWIRMTIRKVSSEITNCAKRIQCQKLPLNITPVVSFDKHVVNINMYKMLCWLLGLWEAGKTKINRRQLLASADL